MEEAFNKQDPFNKQEPFNKQMKAVFTIIDRGQGRSIWVRVGVGFTNRDGSLNLKLDAIPVNGTLQVREWESGDRRHESVEALEQRRGDGHGQGRRIDADPSARREFELPSRRPELEAAPRRADVDALQPRRADAEAQPRSRSPLRDKPADSVV
jgi:hypothetical protein